MHVRLLHALCYIIEMNALLYVSVNSAYMLPNLYCVADNHLCDLRCV